MILTTGTQRVSPFSIQAKEAVHISEVKGNRVEALKNLTFTCELCESFETEPDLCREMNICATIKDRQSNVYGKGHVFRTSLKEDQVIFREKSDSSILVSANQPRGAVKRGDELLIAETNKIAILDAATLKRKDEIRHPQGHFYFLHDIDLSADSKRFLTASTGIACFFEIDIDSKEVTHSWYPHQNGYASYTNNRNECNYTYAINEDGNICLYNTKDQQMLIVDGTISKDIYDEMPLIINSINYDHDESFLATLASHNSAARFSRNGSHTEVVHDLDQPHGHRRDRFFGYRVTSSQNHEAVVFFDKNNQPLHMISFRSRELTHQMMFAEGRTPSWIQNVIELDAENGIYAAIDCSRKKLLVFDIINGKRRAIPYSATHDETEYKELHIHEVIAI